MRLLLNLPLCAALLLAWAMVHMTVLTNPPRGGDAAMGAAIAMLAGSFFFWLLVGATLVCCTMVGGFDWIGGESRGWRVWLVLLAFIGIVVISLLAIGISLETAGRTTSGRWSMLTIWASRVVAIMLPLILLAYAGWRINVDPQPQTPTLNYAWLGVIGALGLVAIAVSIQELGRWNKEANEAAKAEQNREDEKTAERRREFEALSESDTLLKWYEYSTYSSPEDVRLEALRRMSQRPNLEAEIIQVLTSANDLWAAEGVRFVADLDFKPSARVAAAAGQRIATYAAALEKGSKSVTYDGDKRLDYYERSKLLNALKAARRVAETAGADLRPQIDALLTSVALYPKSDMAREFPREAAAARKQIEAALAARPR
jgi:hypothetical protein